MRFYNQLNKFYRGVDLHARTMYLCLLDQGGTIVLHQEVAAEPGAFLEAIAPYRDGLVVACECLFCWYWLADLCQAENIAFVLGHALYLKAIHGGKSKDDKIDAKKIAQLPRGGNLPFAYAYPKGLRETRDRQGSDYCNPQETETWQVMASSRKCVCPMSRPWPERDRR